MEKKIEFKNWWVTTSSIENHKILDAINIFYGPPLGYKETDGKRVHVTLSPVEDPELCRRAQLERK